MKKFGSKLSNRTKVFGGMTILLGIGTVVSAVRDSKEAKAIEGDDDLLLDGISDGLEQIGDAVETVVSEDIVE